MSSPRCPDCGGELEEGRKRHHDQVLTCPNLSCPVVYVEVRAEAVIVNGREVLRFNGDWTVHRAAA